jgi:NitT/TauT family transport system substrate-binding protein
MKKLKRVIAAVTALSLLFTLPGCDKNQSAKAAGPETIKIAYLPLTHALAVFAAKELAEEGKVGANVKIELVKFSSWPELMDALNTGRVDGASVLIELAAKSKEQGIDLKAVALGHHDGNAVIVKPGINSVAELKGATFAIPHRQSSHNILFRQMLADAGIGLVDVNLVELPPPEMPSALASGKIGAYCVAEPFGAKAVTMGAGKLLLESGELWEDSVCCALVLNNAFIKAHADAAKKFTKQYVQAGNYLAANADEGFRIAKKYLTVDEDTLKLSLKWISYKDLLITKKSYDHLTEKMVKFGLTEKPPKYEDFVASELSE